MGNPLLKINNRKKSTSIYLSKTIYSLKKIRVSIKGVEGVELVSDPEKYYCVVLQTICQKEVLNFCNYLFSEHR